LTEEQEMSIALEVISLLNPALASIIHSWGVAGLFWSHRNIQVSIAGMQLAAVARSPPSFLSSGRADPVKIKSTRAVVGFVKRTPQNCAVNIGDELVDPKQAAEEAARDDVSLALLQFRRMTVRALPPVNQNQKTELEKTAMRGRFVAALETLVQQGVPYPPILGECTDPKVVAEARRQKDADEVLDCAQFVRRAFEMAQEEANGTGAGDGAGGKQQVPFPWAPPRGKNQVVQFLYAGEVIEAEQELRPGDLIFYEGSYLSQDGKRGKKPKLFDIVHVEVVAAVHRNDGGGEIARVESFGSRLGDRAARHSSYKAESKAWEIARYHFRSLEPWMEGVEPNPLSIEAYSEYSKHFKREKEEVIKARRAAEDAAKKEEEEAARRAAAGQGISIQSDSSDEEL
jgi:hypothetical protein